MTAPSLSATRPGATPSVSSAWDVSRSRSARLDSADALAHDRPRARKYWHQHQRGSPEAKSFPRSGKRSLVSGRISRPFSAGMRGIVAPNHANRRHGGSGVEEDS